MPLPQLVRSSWQSGLSVGNVRFLKKLVCMQRQSRRGLAAALGLMLTHSGHFRVFSRTTAWRTKRTYAFMHLHL